MSSSHPNMAIKVENFEKRYIIYHEKEDVGVSEGVKSLYELIVNQPNHRSTFFSKELHTSVKNIERWLKQLKDKKKIEFIGSAKTGGYYVK